MNFLRAISQINEVDVTVYHSLALIAIIILVGFAFGKLAEMAKFPHITGYLIGGVLVGVIAHFYFFESVVNAEAGFEIITSIGLGFIAFGIGMEFWFPKLKKTGKKIIIVTAFQSIVTTLVVLFGLLALRVEFWVAAVLAGIAAATAPGPLLMIVKKYKAKGELTSTVIPVVGLDDAFGIMIFSILLSLAVSKVNPSASSSIWSIMSAPLIELGMSLLIGLAMGIPLAVIVKASKMSEHDQDELFLSLTLVTIFAAVAIAKIWPHMVSPILLPMVIGATFTNMVDKDVFLFESRVVDGFQAPIMVAFFAIAGIELGANYTELNIFGIAGFIALAYVILRSFGKMFGAYIGTALGKSSQKVRKWLGICLLPQAGIAIGMAAMIEKNQYFRDYAAANNSPISGHTIYVIVLLGVLIYELFGPSLVKMALEKTGEIKHNVKPKAE